eukprot:Partr_v1_DN28156_c0_g1_i7_m55487 putative serine threonine kinase 11
MKDRQRTELQFSLADISPEDKVWNTKAGHNPDQQKSNKRETDTTTAPFLRGRKFSSDGALSSHHVDSIIVAATEKRRRLHRSVPRVFSYHNGSIVRIGSGTDNNVILRGTSTQSSNNGQHRRKSSNKSAKASRSSDSESSDELLGHERRRFSESSKTHSSNSVQLTSSYDHTALPVTEDANLVPVSAIEMQSEESVAVREVNGKTRLGVLQLDRMVTTSYTESLDVLLHQGTIQQKVNSSSGSPLQARSVDQSADSQPAVTVEGDRLISTSYTDSLDALIKADPRKTQDVVNRRLSVLQEEMLHSRPTSAAYSEPMSITTQNSDGAPIASSLARAFEDMNFIQYQSNDVLNSHKKVVAKLVGKYLMGGLLGEGSYGKVKEGFCAESLKRVAIKIMKQSRIKKIPNGEANVKREIALLKKMHHENVVQLMDVIINAEKQKTYVVIEYCAATLADIMSRAPSLKLPLSQSQRYFQQIVASLGYLHAQGIIHRDIKPGNILVTFDDTIKISDFGVAEEISMYSADDYLTTSSGSPAFQPPEVAAGVEKFAGSKVDIWAIGVTLFHMISGKYPFDGDSIYALFENIAKCEYQIPEEADDILSSLIRDIMTKDPKERLTLVQISDHNWMRAEIPKSDSEVPVLPLLNVQPSDSSHSSEPLDPIIDESQDYAQISNPNFAYDTTLIPYMEAMYEDIPQYCRRSSLKEKVPADFPQKSAFKRKEAIAEKFLRRLSKPVIIVAPEASTSHKRRSSSSSKSTRNSMFSSRTDSEKACKLQ